MNYNQIAILLLQGALVAFVILLLFRLRKRLGIGVLFACLGLLQFIQVFLSSTVYVSITDSLLISPGFSIFFTATLFILLIIYIKEDASETRKLIYALIIVNIVTAILLQTFELYFKEVSSNISSNLFKNSAKVLIVGTIALFLDSLLIIVLFEFISRHIRFLFFRILITMLIVVSFDTFFFSYITFWRFDSLHSILISGLISKGFFTVFYSIIFYVYLKYFDSMDNESTIFKIKDVFHSLSFKQKFESVSDEIKKVEEMYRLLADHSNDLICLHEPDSTFKYISPSVKNLLGYDESEFLGKQIFEILHEDDLKPIEDAIEQKVLSKGVIVDVISCRIRHKEGHFVWIEFVISPVYKEEQISYFVSSGRDITKRVVAEESIKASLELVENSEYSKNEASKIAEIGYWDYDSVTDILTWSDYVYHIYGLDPKDDPLSREEMLVYFDEESQERLLKATSNLDSKGTPYDIELKLINRRKEEIWLRTMVQPIYNLQNEMIGRRGVFQNISASKKAQFEIEISRQEIQTSLDLLEKSENSLKESQKLAKVGSWLFNPLNEESIWSEEVYHIWGLDPKKGNPKFETILNRIHPDDLELHNSSVKKAIGLGIPFEIEFRICLSDDEQKTLRGICQPILGQNGEVISLKGVNQDITAAKKIQHELEFSRQKVQSSLELLKQSEYSKNEASKIAKIGYWEYDITTDSFTWSDYVYHIFGFDPKDVIPSRKEMVSFYDKESQEKLERATLELNITGIPYDIEFRLINLKKEEIWVRNVVQPIYNQQNEVVGRRGVIQNITTSKKVQLELELSKLTIESSFKQLEKSEYSKNEASKIAEIGYWEYDKTTDTFTSSDAVYYIFGINPRDAIPAREKIVSCYDKESQEKLAKAILELTLNGTPFDLEFKIINLKKEEVWVRNVVQPLYNDKNEIIGRRGVTQNITISKKAQLELELSKKEIQATLKVVKENEYSLKEAGRMAKIGYWRYDKQVDTIFWSKAIHKIYGTDPNDKVPDIETILSVFNEKSRIKLIEATVILATDGIAFDIELEMTNLKNERRWIRNIGEPIYNDKNEIVGRRGISQDITEQKLKQNEIDYKNEKLYGLNNALNAAQEMAQVGSWFYDVSSKTSEWSDETFRIWGFDSNKPIPDEDEFLSRIHKDDIESFHTATDLVFSHGASYDIEYRICLDDGEEKTVRSICKPIFGDDGDVVSLNGVNQDITAQKRRQQELDHKNEKLYELNNALNEAQELAHVGSWFYDYSSKESEWSDETFRIWGYDVKSPAPNEAAIVSRIHKDDLELFNRAGELVYSEGIPFDIEFRIYLDNNEEKTVRSICKPIFGDDGAVLSLKGTNQDITAQKRAIDKIEKAEEMYRVLTDYSNDLICLHELDSTFKYISPSVKSLLGYEQSELLGKKVFGIVHKDDLEHLISVMKERASNNMFTDAFSCRVLHKEGYFIWLEFLSSPVYKDKEIIHFVSSARNITQKVLADQKIKTSLALIEKKEFDLLEVGTMAKIGYWEYDHLTATIMWSEYLYHIFGFDPNDEIPTRNEIMTFFDKQSQKRIEQATILLTTKGTSYDLELKLINQKKEEIWVRNVVQPIYNKQNEIVGRRGLFQNITTSKKAQFELELSKQELKTSLELLGKSEASKNDASEVAKIGYWEYNFVENTFIWSDYIYRIYGLDPKDKIPSELELIALYDEESKEKIVEVIQSINLGSLSVDIELRFTNFKNVEVWERSVVQPMYNDRNEIVGRRGVMQDITASKKAQFELELSKQEIETSLNLLEKSEYTKNEANKVAKIGYHEYDIATDVFIWSEYLYDIFGFDKTKRVPPREEVFSLFDMESQDKMKQATLELDLKGIPYDLELKVNNLNNEEVWVRNIAEPVYNEQGELIGRRGITQNITSFKKVQLDLELSKQEVEVSLELLEKSEFSKNEASKTAKMGYVEYDVATDVFTWSDYNHQIFGYDPKEPTPSRKEVFAFFDKESQKKIKEATLKLHATGAPYDLELRLINKNKKEVWARSVIEPIYNEQKEIIGRRGVFQDITVSKKASLELEFSRKEITKSLKLLEISEYSKNEASKVAKIGYWNYSKITDIFTWSEYIYQIFGLNPKDEIPLQEVVLSYYDDESRERLLESIQNLNVKGVPYDIELKFINNKKEEIWTRNVAQPVYDEQGEIIGRRGVLQDISASKKAQFEIAQSNKEVLSSLELLRQSEYSKNEASKTAKMGFVEYIVETDTFTWSEYLYHIFGLDPKNGTPSRKEVLAFFDKESQKKIKEATIDLHRTGNPYDIEVRLINKNNKEVWARSVIEPIFNEQKEIIGRRGVFQDVTISKKARLELELSKQKIAASLKLLETSEYSKNEASKVARIGYWEHDLVNATAKWSDFVHQIFGSIPANGIPPQNVIVELFDNESQEIFTEATLALISKGIPYDIELKIINLKKEQVWIRNVAQPIYNKQKEIIGKRGVMQDITSSKKAQLAAEVSRKEIANSLKLLEINEKSKNETSQIAKLGYHEYNFRTGIFTCSDYVYQIFGLDPKNGTPSRKKLIKTFDKESQKKLAKVTLKLDQEGISYDHELKLINHKNETVWVRSVVQPIYNNENEIIGRRGIIQNITDRKIIEAEHLRIKNDFRRLFDNATVSVWNEDFTLIYKEIDELRKQNIPNIRIYLERHPEILFSLLDKVKVNSVNKVTLELFKAKSHQEFLSRLQDTFGEGAHKVFMGLIEAIWNNDKAFTSEVNYKTLEGDEFAALLSISIPQTEIEQKTVPASIQSIQSLKDAELEKRESEKKLNIAEKLAGIGSWIFDVSTQKNEWSEEMFNIWNFDEKDGAPDYDTIINRIHTDDLELFNGVIDEVIANGTPYDIEFRITTPNTEIKWIRGICEPIYGENGVVVSLSGSNQDVTSQKKAIDDIEKAEEMYRILTDNSNDLICLQEPDSTFKYISPSIINILGYDQSEYLGKHVFGIVHKDDITRLKGAMGQKVFQGKTIEAFSFRVRHKKGHFVWLEFLSSPVYKENEVSYFVTTARDITQWVFAQQEIEEYQTSLQQMTTEMTFIEEKQKKEIASNIHDHLSQSLVISKMKINELKKNKNLKIIDEDLKFIETHISEALENTRKITYELSPPVLYQLGIIDALNWLFEEVESTHKIACNVHSNVSSIELSELKSILLYRSIQELMKNAVKYANASLIRLELDRNKLGVHILLTDNGIGFETSVLNNYKNHSGSGFGLFAVQERIRNIQGKFEISSEINIGTSVKIFIPLAI